jgi:hypothetical protein
MGVKESRDGRITVKRGGASRAEQRAWARFPAALDDLPLDTSGTLPVRAVQRPTHSGGN